MKRLFLRGVILIFLAGTAFGETTIVVEIDGVEECNKVVVAGDHAVKVTKKVNEEEVISDTIVTVDP